MRQRIILLAFIFVLIFTAKVSANEEEDLSEYSFEQVEKTLEKSNISFSYEELVKKADNWKYKRRFFHGQAKCRGPAVFDFVRK